MIPCPPPVPSWQAERDRDPLIQRVRALLALLDWECVPERDPHRPWPGRPPHPQRAYLKALLLKVADELDSSTRLRRFLLDHPLLVLELGFEPVPDASQPFGFDVARTVPGARWLRHHQQHLDASVLQRLLHDTVHSLQRCLPELGTTVAVDVKHLYAWVRENNPKQQQRDRFVAARQPRGDPDCRVGCKAASNQATTSAKHYLWGYGSGVLSAIDPVHGDLVLAEYTQPFNCADVTYFQPLYQHASVALGQPPRNVTADAAFDAWYVYQRCAEVGGLAAIPRNERRPGAARDAAGQPICAQGLVMTPGVVYAHERGYPAQRYRCPLLHPSPSGQSCDHPAFAAGRGCTAVVNLSLGGQQRQTLDRQSTAYADLYRQRTSVERINSQATALGIERPRLRRLASVARRNSLIYVVINLRALHRLHHRQQGHDPSLC